MLVLGTWDGDRDGYFENGTDFTVLLKRSRLYRSFKQTPVHLSGIKDAQANAHQLIDDGSRRGKKVGETDIPREPLTHNIWCISGAHSIFQGALDIPDPRLLVSVTLL